MSTIITLCSDADKASPIIDKYIEWSLYDPAGTQGSMETRMRFLREVRDAIGNPVADLCAARERA